MAGSWSSTRRSLSSGGSTPNNNKRGGRKSSSRPEQAHVLDRVRLARKIVLISQHIGQAHVLNDVNSFPCKFGYGVFKQANSCIKRMQSVVNHEIKTIYSKGIPIFGN